MVIGRVYTRANRERLDARLLFVAHAAPVYDARAEHWKFAEISMKTPK